MRVKFFLLCLLLSDLAIGDDSLQGAVSLYEQGALDEAQAKFESLQNADPGHAETYYYLGLIQQSRGAFMEAAEYFEKAVELDQLQSRYYQGLGEAYGSAAQDVSFFKQMRLAGKIRDAFQRSVELDGDNIDARSGLITFYVNAPGVAGGSEEKALQQAREIGKRNTFRGHLALATVYQSQGDGEATEREYRAAIETSPDEMDPYQALGIFFTSEERFDEAVEVYESALLIDPGAMGVTYQLGRTASISGEYLERGAAAFKAYLEYTPLPDEPGLDWANYRLGLIYQHQGDKEQAKHHFQQALEINSKHPEAKKALKKIGR